MAFTAKIESIDPHASDNGLDFLVGVTFTDSATGFTKLKTYTFAINTSQAAAVAQITADGNQFKSGLGTISNLQSKVGTTITI